MLLLLHFAFGLNLVLLLLFLLPFRFGYQKIDHLLYLVFEIHLSNMKEKQILFKYLLAATY